MDNFNRVISFVLGLIVVIVFIVIISGRFNLKEKLLSGASPTKTPTPTRSATTPVPTRFPTAKPIVTGSYNENNTNVNGKKPTTIPSTGSPTLLLPLLFSSLGAGIFLKKRG